MKIIGLREYELAWGEGSAAIVLYEDYRSGCVGKAFVEWIGASEGGDLGGRLGLWRFDILDLPGVDTEVCEGLARADLLVVSVRPGSDVPESISAKVAAWGERLVDPTLPIVVLGGVCAAEAPRMVGLRSLRRWAGRLGMPMVCAGENGWVEPDYREGLGFEDDERDFRLGARILQAMGFSAVRLMTNNPAKVAMMRACGLDVAERAPLRVGRTRFNAGYLDTKAAKSGHLL